MLAATCGWYLRCVEPNAGMLNKLFEVIGKMTLHLDNNDNDVPTNNNYASPPINNIGNSLGRSSPYGLGYSGLGGGGVSSIFGGYQPSGIKSIFSNTYNDNSDNNSYMDKFMNNKTCINVDDDENETKKHKIKNT